MQQVISKIPANLTLTRIPFKQRTSRVTRIEKKYVQETNTNMAA